MIFWPISTAPFPGGALRTISHLSHADELDEPLDELLLECDDGPDPLLAELRGDDDELEGRPLDDDEDELLPLGLAEDGEPGEAPLGEADELPLLGLPLLELGRGDDDELDGIQLDDDMFIRPCTNRAEIPAPGV